jgi:very-short-patch-repair endonuclease
VGERTDFNLRFEQVAKMVIPAKRFKPKITKEEHRLQAHLKKEGIPFTPQTKIKTKSGRTYLVDFLIPPNIVVEVGHIGITDIQEDEDLKETGYTVLRFQNKEINHKIKKVMQTIKKTIGETQK